MASYSIRPALLVVLVLAMATSKIALASDLTSLASDFIIPSNRNFVDGKFTYTGTRGVLDNNPEAFKITKASLAKFPALSGQSVSFAGGVNPPPTHPRAAGLLFLVDGCLEVGFVDTKNILHTQRLQHGDNFVFQKYNPDPKKE